MPSDDVVVMCAVRGCCGVTRAGAWLVCTVIEHVDVTGDKTGQEQRQKHAGAARVE